MPVHEHDCEACRFVGTVGPGEGDPRTNAVDEYVCRSPRTGSITLIRRYGSEPSDYGSWLLEGVPVAKRYAGTAARARAAGMLGNS